MRKTTLKNAKQLLLDMKRQILREISEDLKHGREGAKDDGMDTYDLASEERDREINFILSDREREKLQSIEEALERIEDGSYGICESCESDIAEARLLALPFTRLCVTCQGEREKEAKMNRRAEPDANRRFSVGDADEGES